MSHATDGELHAYLDGGLSSIDPVRADRVKTHLDGCGDCTARLEEARALRARAGEILADAEPELVEVPPFEAILEHRAEGRSRREAGGPGAADVPALTQIRRVRPPLAWAASVAVALGVGWLAHATWSGAGVDDVTSFPMAQTPAVTGGRGPESAESQTGAAEAGFAEGVAVTARSDDAPGAPGRQTDPRTQARLEDRAAEPADEARAMAERIAVSELVVPAEQLAESRPSPEMAQERARRAAETGEGNEALRNVQRAAQDTTRERDIPVELEDLEAGVDAREEGAPRRLSDEGVQQLRYGLALDPRVVGGLVSWLTVSRADAEHWIGGPVLEVPDLAPATLAISKLGEARLVRATQTLPGGETLELIQKALATGEAVQAREAPGAEGAAPAAFKADVAQSTGALVIIERDGFRIAARAEVATDSLRILLSKLR